MNPNLVFKSQPVDEARPWTAGAVADDHVLDLIRTPGGALRLVCWDGAQLSEATSELCIGGRSYRLPSVEPSWLAACSVPSRVGDRVGCAELWAQLRSFSEDFLHMDEDHATIVFAFVFGTWFADVLPLVPALWATGPESSDGINLLRLLHCVCRRAIVLDDWQPASLFQVPRILAPTILARAANSSKIASHLEKSRYRGLYVPHAGSLTSTHYAAGLVSRDLPPSSAPLLQLALAPNTVDFPMHLPAGLVRTAAELQAAFLRYRLENYQRVATADFAEPPFSSPGLRQLAGCLAACFDCLDIQAAVVRALAPLEEQERLLRATDLRAIVVEALLLACHEESEEITVGELAVTVNALLRLRDESLALKSRKVGSILDQLGLERTQCGNHGLGFRLDNAFRARVHQLANHYAAFAQPLPECRECRMFPRPASQDASLQGAGSAVAVHGAADVNHVDEKEPPEQRVCRSAGGEHCECRECRECCEGCDQGDGNEQS